jgi:hypothetical protein
MDTQAKVRKIFEEGAEKFIKLQASINGETNSYDFEQSFQKALRAFGHDLYQAMLGGGKVTKNERMQLFTSVGEVILNKSHPLAVCPGGFKISPYLQEQMCRAGTKMTFEESSEELNKLLGIKANAKQIERICHRYGEELERTDWSEIYKDSVQPRMPSGRQLYVLMDGSMLLTRDRKQSWREVKLCRMFYNEDRIENVSKKRNMLTGSRYVAHLGNHEEFLDKVLDAIPAGAPPVFIADGAKWIWNWIDEYYPGSIQILDFYHCKEHLCQFARQYFPEDESKAWVEQCVEHLKTEQVDVLLDDIEKLPPKKAHLQKEKEKLLNYPGNNKKRINYGKFIGEGLLTGSGAIESANRDVIQKRMKLSGQRWTLQGAKQMLNLRTCYKSGSGKIIKKLIADNKKVA